jgi:hypothetical protein
MLALALGAVALIAPVAALASSAPVIERETLTRLTPTDGTLTAKIDPGGLEASYQFEMWRSCPEHANGATCEFIEEIPLPSGTLPASSGGERVSLKLDRAGVVLAAGSEYGYSVKATNDLGSAHGLWQNFEAPLPGLPAIYSESVAHLTTHSATINARINPEGSEVTYEVWFWPGCGEGACERGPPHVVATGYLAAATSAHAVRAKLTGLQPGSSNNGYWVVATSSSGTSEGILQTFATPSSAAR